MPELNVFLLTAAAVIGAVALFAVPLKRFVAPPLIALLAGILIGAPFSPASRLVSTQQMTILEQAARIALAVGLMAAALRVKKQELRRQWKPAAILLGLLMPLMWLFSSIIVYLIFGTGILAAFVAGAIVTPTDPIAAGSVVTGKLAEEKIPKDLRALVSLESGANDGLNYPFVWLPLLLLKHAPGEALRDWFLKVLLWQVIGAAAIGLVAGYLAGRIARWAEENEVHGATYLLIFSTALALFTLAAAKLAGTDGILAVFAAGLVFNCLVEGSELASPEEVQDALDLLFTAPVFMLIGMTLPWREWGALGWKAAVFPVCLMLFRRFPAVAMIFPLLSRWHGRSERLLVGWAGPIGIASVYYAALVSREVKWHDAWVIGSLAVFSSVVVHGLLTAPVVKAVGPGAGDGQ